MARPPAPSRMDSGRSEVVSLAESSLSLSFWPRLDLTISVDCFSSAWLRREAAPVGSSLPGGFRLLLSHLGRAGGGCGVVLSRLSSADGGRRGKSVECGGGGEEGPTGEEERRRLAEEGPEPRLLMPKGSPLLEVSIEEDIWKR